MTDEEKIDLFNEIMTRKYAHIQKDDTPTYWGESYDPAENEYEHDECATFDELIEQMEYDTQIYYDAWTKHYQEMLKRFKLFKETLFHKNLYSKTPDNKPEHEQP